jgi:hypothetical protein
MPPDLVSVPLDQLICRFYRVSEMPLIHLACEHYEGSIALTLCSILPIAVTCSNAMRETS